MKTKKRLEKEKEGVVEECLEDIRNQMRLNMCKIKQHKGKEYTHKEYRISSNKIGKLRHFIDKVYKRATLTQTNEIIVLIEDVDLELFFTDIVDGEGKKIKDSKEIMDLMKIFWGYVSEELLTKIKGDGE